MWNVLLLATVDSVSSIHSCTSGLPCPWQTRRGASSLFRRMLQAGRHIHQLSSLSRTLQKPEQNRLTSIRASVSWNNPFNWIIALNTSRKQSSPKDLLVNKINQHRLLGLWYGLVLIVQSEERRWYYGHMVHFSMFFRGGGSRCTLCSPGPPWRSFWCWHRCSQDSLERIEKNKSCLFVKSKNMSGSCHSLDNTQAIKKTKHMHSVKVKSSGGLRVGMWGNPATHPSLLFLRCSRERKARNWYHFVLLLTFLQLSHQVVVLEESISAECVCEQHLEKTHRQETDWTKPKASRTNTTGEAVQSTESHRVMKWEVSSGNKSNQQYALFEQINKTRLFKYSRSNLPEENRS